MSFLIAGATGLVGGEALRLALADAALGPIVAPTRRPLALAVPGGRLTNPVVDLANPPASIFDGVDAIACALGSTRRKARAEATREGTPTSAEAAFRARDPELILAFARAARAAGVARIAFVSSVGADAQARSLYLRTRGELERDLAGLGFTALTILRPSFLDGPRSESRPLERLGLGLARLLRPLTPPRYRPISAAVVAAALLASLAAARSGVTILESEQIAAGALRA